MLALMLVTFNDTARRPNLMVDYEAGEDIAGYIVCSPIPADLILVQVDAPEAMIDTIHARLMAADGRLGLYVPLEA